MTALRATASLLLGAAIGAAASWTYFDSESPRSAADNSSSLSRRAALAHSIYAPEVRHPVEVGAGERAHLIAWLSKRLEADVRPPELDAEGFAFAGGRLLPGNALSANGTLSAAQFMYGNANGRRVTLYVRNAGEDERRFEPRHARVGGAGTFRWIEGRLACAFASGDLGRSELLRLAESVRRQGRR